MLDKLLGCIEVSAAESPFACRMNGMSLWAHSRNVAGNRHRLVDHLRGTAELARRFGEPFGAGALCYAAGLAHDLGKATPEWQHYLDLSDLGLSADRVNHKTPGADLLSKVAGEQGRLMVEGHHGGIPNCQARSVERDREREEQIVTAMRDVAPELAALLDGPSVIPPHWVPWVRSEPTTLEMGIRLAHSTLVDADFLDTAAHFNDTTPQIRQASDFMALQGHFDRALDELLASRSASPVDGLRTALLDDCRAAASRPRGVFRLPAPTGSGKTISAAAFAIRHAATHGMSRVVVAVPFLTITEQNAAIYRRLLGSQNVIEHHSGLSLDDLAERSAPRAKLGVENWDAPFVVTTTVQLFESLFSNRPSKTRKLHRLVNAVIVLDEIQAIPPPLLPIILDGLRTLTQHFGATVVLSSATQPTWDMVGAWRDAAHLNLADIVPDPGRLYEGMRRSRVEWGTYSTLDSLADAVASERQAMVIVNTTGDARDLAREVRDRVPEGTYHLSTRMYPRHRRDVLSEVRARLTAGLPVRLVSTQVVEAGVDVDFPTVFRAKAPAESLSQARGRCNREGRQPSGRFVIVDCPELGQLADYRVGIQVADKHLRTSGLDLDDPVLMRAYYEDLYSSLRVDDDPFAKQIQKARSAWGFESTAMFRMISETSFPVVIHDGSDDVAAALAEISASADHRTAPGPRVFRRLQDFTVNVSDRLRWQASNLISEEIRGISVWRGPYDRLTGVSIDSNLPNDSVY